MSYNASNKKDVRAAEKRVALARSQRLQFIHTMMTSVEGRAFVWDLLSDCDIFKDGFSLEPTLMARSAGRRSIGLRLLEDVTAACPDQYIVMIREANDNDRYNSDNGSAKADRSTAGEQQRSAPNGRDVEGSDSDYDPFGGEHRTEAD